ncbi:MAG: hypothetical protein H6662_02905 [Ardenticatenaceae bacterium]|nr:hypothetical protein [Ardenticatenaceae bacterium]
MALRGAEVWALLAADAVMLLVTMCVLYGLAATYLASAVCLVAVWCGYYLRFGDAE